MSAPSETQREVLAIRAALAVLRLRLVMLSDNCPEAADRSPSIFAACRVDEAMSFLRTLLLPEDVA